jgi:YVTN family beta-propeller protein
MAADIINDRAALTARPPSATVSSFVPRRRGELGHPSRRREIVGRIPVGDGPSHLALSVDGSRIYSANSWDGTLSCVTADGEHVGSAFSGRWAHAIAATPDGRWVYVANFFDDTLSVFDADSLERVAVLATDAYPHGPDISRMVT